MLRLEVDVAVPMDRKANLDQALVTASHFGQISKAKLAKQGDHRSTYGAIETAELSCISESVTSRKDAILAVCIKLTACTHAWIFFELCAVV